MSVAKLSIGGAVNAMKTEEGNESPDTLIKQAVQKEPLLSFPKTGDSPVRCIQLLHALEQPGLPGWSLMTPLKVTMKKCEKCSQEFCSPVNYRRHIRVHRRSLNVNKESNKTKDLLAAFWDKLSLEEAREVLSLKDASLKEVTSSSVIEALASSLHQPRVRSVRTLPQVYVNAGSTLLDIIRANTSRLPISSQELFSILDDASENTFLCAGTAESLQKYVFDEETAKHSLKLTNLIACTTFLFEQQLVKAWVSDKDAEALRCQKLLVEEEEAAKRRQAELLERKKLKKLRQKEQKMKDQLNGCKAYLNLSTSALDDSFSGAVPDPPSPSDSNLNSPEMPVNVASFPESIQFPSEEIEDTGAQFDFSSENIDAANFQTVETWTMNSDARQHLATNSWQVAKSQKGGRNGFCIRPDLQALKPEPLENLTSPKDHGPLLNGSKAWTDIFNVDNEESKPGLQGETSNQPTEQNSFELMIGSISVTLRDPDEVKDTSCTKHAIPEKSDILEKPVKHSFSMNRHETSGIRPVDKGGEESGGSVLDEAGNQTVCSERSMLSCSVDSNDRDGGKHSVMFSDENAKEGEESGGSVLDEAGNQTVCSERSMLSCSVDSDDRDGGKHSVMFSDENAKEGGLAFRSIAAKEFIAERWKKAIASNHVKLDLSSELEGTEDNCSMAAQTSDLPVNGNTEKQLLGLEASSGSAQF